MPNSRTLEDVTVVVATRDRSSQLLESLAELRAASGDVAVVVVDNASSDDTADAVRTQHPDMVVISLDRNEGAVARNIGAATATTELVAFADDDSWWANGSLVAASKCFAQHDRLGLISARVLVGPDHRLDPISSLMARSPLRSTPTLPGRPILGFLACAAIVRRSAFLEVGGFSRTLGFAGEEDVVAWDMADRGWHLRYLPEAVVHHHPRPSGRNAAARVARLRRNAVLSAMLRRPPSVGVRQLVPLVRAAATEAASRHELGELIQRTPTALRARRRLTAETEADLRLLAHPSSTEMF